MQKKKTFIPETSLIETLSLSHSFSLSLKVGWNQTSSSKARKEGFKMIMQIEWE